MSILTNSYHLALFISCVNALIIPEELPSILSVIYSNIPPIKKGTDSRVGVGFRLGNHADFQVLLELGPQVNTQPLGPAKDGKKRRQTHRPALVVLPSTGAEKVADTPGGKWLSSWRSALVNPQSSVDTNKYTIIQDQEVTETPMEGKDDIASHLHQLYKNANKQTENTSKMRTTTEIISESSDAKKSDNATSLEFLPTESASTKEST